MIPRYQKLKLLIVGISLALLHPVFGQAPHSQSGVSSAGLVVRYHCNGNSHDASGNGHHGKVHQALLTGDRWGKPNQAYAFDGKNSYISLPAKALPASKAFTMAAWVKDGDGRGGYLIHLCSRELRCEIGMRVLADRRIVVFDGSGNRTYSTSKLNANSWQHVAVTVDAARPQQAQFKIYIDGELDHSSVSPYEPNAAGTVFAIGSFFGSNRVFKGAMDDIVIYGRTLADDEIQRLLWDLPAVAESADIRAERLSDDDVKSAWDELAHEDITRANLAMWRLASSGEQAVKWLRKKLAASGTENKSQEQVQQQISKLIDQLDADQFSAREKAVQQLLQIGAAARPPLERVLKESPSPELRFRAKQVLAGIDASDAVQRLDPESLRRARVIYALDCIATNQAVELLALMKQSARSTVEGERATAALDRLK